MSTLRKIFKKPFLYFVIAIAFLCICLFCSCNPSSQDNNQLKDESQYVEESTWKNAYINYINNLDTKWKDKGTYTLINMGNGNVPALYYDGDSMAMSAKLAYYYNGDFKVIDIRRCGFEYIEGLNKIKNSEGNMGAYYDLVYTFKDGDFQLIFDGKYGDRDNTKPEINPDGSMKYIYKISNNEVEKDEYNKQLNESYDPNRTKRIEMRSGLTWSKMLQELSQ